MPDRSHKKCQVSWGQIQPYRNHLFCSHKFLLKNVAQLLNLKDLGCKSRSLASFDRVEGWVCSLHGSQGLEPSGATSIDQA